MLFFKRELIIITGMHRSGTSILAHILRSAGLPFGGPLLNGARRDNPLGYGEHAAVVEIHERLLKTLGRTWHGSYGDLPLPGSWLVWPDTQGAGRDLLGIMEEAFAQGPIWAVKDPRISRFIPLWRSLADVIGARLRVILCRRHPLEVAASLAQRNKTSISKGLHLRRVHVEDAERDIVGLDRFVVNFDETMNDPEGVITRVFDWLGLPLTGADASRAARLVAPQLRHHMVQGTIDEEAATTPRRGIVGCVAITMQPSQSIKALPAALRGILSQNHEDWRLSLNFTDDRLERAEPILSAYRAAIGSRLVQGEAREAARYSVRHPKRQVWSPDFLERSISYSLAHGRVGQLPGLSPLDRCRQIFVRRDECAKS